MASDDELERRLRQLKGLEPPGGGGSGAGSGARSGAPALEGEVIEPGARARSGGGASGPGPSGPAGPGSPAGGQAPGVGTRVVSWSVSQAAAGRIGLWFGVALVVVGGYYVLAAFVPGVRVAGSLGLAALGAFLLLSHVRGAAGEWARTIGAILIGAGLLPFIAGVAGFTSDGWGSLGAGLGLLALGAFRASRGRGWGWQGVLGAVLSVWGAWGVLHQWVPGFPSIGDLIVPVILVLIGVSILRRGARG